MHEDVYVPLDLNNPVEAALFKKVSPLITHDKCRLGVWGAHSFRVALLTTYTALEMKLSLARTIDYGAAAYTHDLGKSEPSIAEIFQKQGELTAEERDLAKLHGVLGAARAKQIYDEHCSLAKLRLIMLAQLTHHLKYSGDWLYEDAVSLLYDEEGPKYFAAQNIPRIGRIIKVVDSFDTMVSKRTYPKPVLSYEAACQELKDGAESLFDPFITEIFVSKVVPVYTERRRVLQGILDLAHVN